MARRTSLSIRARLWWGFGTLFALLLATNLIVAGLLAGLADSVASVNQLTLPRDRAAVEMEVHATEAVAAVAAYLASPRPEDREQFAGAAVNFERAASLYQSLARTPEQRALSRRLGEGFAQLSLVANGLLDGRDRQRVLFPEVGAALDELDAEFARSSQFTRRREEARVAAVSSNAWLGNYLRTEDRRFRLRALAALDRVESAAAGAGAKLAALASRRRAQVEEVLTLHDVQSHELARLNQLRAEMDRLLDSEVQTATRDALDLAATTAQGAVRFAEGLLLALLAGAAVIALVSSVGVGRSIVHTEAAEREARRLSEERAAELGRLRDNLVRRNRDLDEFAYVASHDLKAPLRAIANLAHWIEEDSGERLSAESRGHLELLVQRSGRMDALIDGILAYSRAGRAQVAAELVDVAALLDEIEDSLQPAAAVTIEVGAAMPTLMTDRLALSQVLSNLLGNAIKHAARPGRVRVAVRLRDSYHEFSVSDDGRGIAPQFHDKIWKIFQTLEAGAARQGTGIGLALVKKIVEERGGRAWVESEEGRGATFYFTWPVSG